jgi:hypothetical protein
MKGSVRQAAGWPLERLSRRTGKKIPAPPLIAVSPVGQVTVRVLYVVLSLAVVFSWTFRSYA